MDKVETGFVLGAAIGLSVGGLFGSVSSFRYVHARDSLLLLLGSVHFKVLSLVQFV